MAGFVALALAGHAVADEVDGSRPWGRLSKPSLSAPASTSQRGYLGRYNPWSSERKSESREPQYRQRDSAAAPDLSPSGVPYGYPAVQPYTVPPAYPGYGQGGAAPYAAPPLYGGMAPWGGGLNPDYGGYWNDPYNTLQPDRGILWSDMWR
ncbi:MAG: hypothetical protein OQL08_09625 [Gammaproteobacteria bacterium]|nr:hypothetical protein [Gammaproteobacteria bacterium]